MICARKAEAAPLALHNIIQRNITKCLSSGLRQPLISHRYHWSDSVAAVPYGYLRCGLWCFAIR